MEKKLTIGDKIRRELINPDSLMSQAVQRWNAWKYRGIRNPKRYQLSFDVMGTFHVFDRKTKQQETGCMFDIGELLRMAGHKS